MIVRKNDTDSAFITPKQATRWLLFTAEMHINCAFKADIAVFLMFYAHRKAILNGKNRYYSQTEWL